MESPYVVTYEFGGVGDEVTRLQLGFSCAEGEGGRGGGNGVSSPRLLRNGAADAH